MLVFFGFVVVLNYTVFSLENVLYFNFIVTVGTIFIFFGSLLSVFLNYCNAVRLKHALRARKYFSGYAVFKKIAKNAANDYFMFLAIILELAINKARIDVFFRALTDFCVFKKLETSLYFATIMLLCECSNNLVEWRKNNLVEFNSFVFVAVGAETRFEFLRVARAENNFYLSSNGFYEIYFV